MSIDGLFAQPGILVLQNFDENGDNLRESFSEDPFIERQVEAFRDNILDLETPEELFEPQNAETLNFVLTAFGLQDRQGDTGLLERALLEPTDTAEEDSLVAALTDTRIGFLRDELLLGDVGLSVLQDETVIDQLVEDFQENLFVTSQGSQNPNVPDAIVFRENANLVESEFEILADPVLRNVVFTVLGIPEEVAVQDVDTQAELITSQLDIEDLQDPDFVQDFTERFLVQSDINSGLGGGNPDALLVNLFA